jgi:hypothetical protein
MADIPRDPRQLARDILAGKVRIEDLAKERQRAAGIPAPLPRPVPERMPDKIPLPNMGRPVPPPQARRPAPPPRPAQRQPPVKAKPLEKRRPPAPVAVPPVQRPTSPLLATPAASTPAREPALSAYAAASELKQAASDAHREKGTPLAQLLRSPKSLKQAILLSEVLGKPVSMRDDQFPS